ncbi:MAG: hypothetical protein HeimC3_53680 [Candidatus Heimdallarchaeota archaeon LC_3]|nr:MAG: hypothetical protein HeimC3_53680 [Candidatus Heimdallarchaeota archaeon LC_3]
MSKSLPKISELIRDVLNLSKTESNILFLLWSQKNNNYQIIKHELTKDDFIMEFDRKLLTKGLSIKDFMNILYLTQSSIQKAMNSLISKTYVSRVKVNKEFRYSSTSLAFLTFQKELSSFQKNFSQYLAPLLSNSNPEKAFKDISQQIRNDWVFDGWREHFGRENFLFHSKNNSSGGLNKNDLEMFKRDTDGSELTDLIQQISVGNSLYFRTGKPYTSILHLQANIQQSLWNIQCSQHQSATGSN